MYLETSFLLVLVSGYRQTEIQKRMIHNLRYAKNEIERLMSIKEKGQSYINLSKDEHQGLSSLANNAITIIRHAEKEVLLLFGLKRTVLKTEKKIATLKNL